jgi:hypothetical protein
VHNLVGAKQSLTDLSGFEVGPWANVTPSMAVFDIALRVRISGTTGAQGCRGIR